MNRILFLVFYFLLLSINAQVKKHPTNGLVKETGTINSNGQKVGEWITYSYSGNIYSIENFGENQRDWLLFYGNGNPRESGSYISNKKTGEWLKFDKDGCLTSIGTLKDNAYEGERRRYHMDKLFAVEHYKDRKKTGKWLWYKDGEIVSQEQNYVEDKADGEQKSYYENGNLIYVRFYDKGRAIGIHKEFFKSGQVKQSKTFDNGHIIEEIGYYETGTINRVKTILKNKSISKGFYENGTRSHVGQSNKPLLDGFNTMVGDNHIGVWRYYHSNGKLHYKGRYVKGQRSGKWKGWHINGNRKFKGKYEAGEKVGKWKYYDENGKRKEE